MFEVPDWGKDIPKSGVELSKLFTKKSKNKHTKSNVEPKSNNNKINNKNNHIKKNGNTFKSAKTKMNSHTNLSKDDHINNRFLRRSLKITLTDPKDQLNIDKENSTGKTALKVNLSNRIDVNNKLKNKILERKGKVPKLVSNINQPKKSDNIIIQQNNGNFRDTSKTCKNPKSQKRERAENCNTHDNIDMNNTDIQSLNIDDPDKILMNAKRKKINNKIENDDIEDVLFGDKVINEEEPVKEDVVIPNKKTTIQKKKEKFKQMLARDSNRNIIRNNSNKLRERMLERLKAAQFRYLNEKLYTSSGTESQELFKSDPVAFQTYHEGYQLQVKKWPVNPLDLIVKRIQKMPKTHLIADMGCGEAALSRRVPQTVRSFDLVANTPGVEACNMAHTPLLAASMDVVVFCLALMGTDLARYLLEANRVLKIGGHLLIAEVESRFENVDSFTSDVQRLGFSLKKVDKSHQVFFFMEFSKVRDASAKRNKLPALTLKPCFYKRR